MIQQFLLVGLSLSICAFSGFAADDDPKKEEKKADGKRFGGIGGDPETRFKKMDGDSDGKVTKEEFKKSFNAFGGALGKGNGQGANRGEFGDRMFDRMDADKDGKLTLEEYKQAHSAISGLFGGANGRIDPEKLKQLQNRFKKKNDN